LSKHITLNRILVGVSTSQVDPIRYDIFCEVIVNNERSKQRIEAKRSTNELLAFLVKVD